MTIRLEGIQHVGVPVSDMQRTLRFYREAFGLEPDFVHNVAPSSELDLTLGVDGAQLTIAFMRLGNTYLELLEYRNADRDVSYGRRNCDVGATHVCFEVEDIGAAYDALRAKGVAFYSEPLLVDDGPLKGYTFCYLMDPDGVTLELLEAPAEARTSKERAL